MKETGLMFKAPLVRAILSGQKTQTRRVIKDQSIGDRWCESRPDGRQYLEWQGQPSCGTGVWDIPEYNAEIVSPFGLIGDRIYVRETWQGPLMSSKEWEDHYFSEADDIPAKFRTPAHCQYAADGGPPPEFATMDDDIVARWKPSIHMPKWAARIWLEVTGVRVERLQDISESDTQAEGCSIECMTPTGDDNGSAIHGPGGFAALWDSTTDRPSLPANENSKRYARVKQWLDTHPDTASWAANPWVWVIDFKRIDKPAAL